MLASGREHAPRPSAGAALVEVYEAP